METIKVNSVSAGTNPNSPRSVAFAEMPNNDNVILFYHAMANETGDLAGDVYSRTLNIKTHVLGEETIVNESTQGLQDGPATATLANGDIIVCWRDSNTISVDCQRYDSNGSAIGMIFTAIKNDGICKSSGSYNVAIASLEDQPGKFVVAATTLKMEYGSYSCKVYAAIFGLMNNLENNFWLPSVNCDTGETHLTSLKEGGFLASWTSFCITDNNVYATKFDSKGNEVSKEFSLYIFNKDHSIALLENDDVVISSTSDETNSNVYEYLFNGNLTEKLSHARVNSNIHGKQSHSNVVDLENGHYMVSYYSTQDNEAWKTFAKIYNNEGTVVSFDFQITGASNSTDTGFAQAHAIDTNSVAVTMIDFTNKDIVMTFFDSYDYIRESEELGKNNDSVANAAVEEVVV